MKGPHSANHPFAHDSSKGTCEQWTQPCGPHEEVAGHSRVRVNALRLDCVGGSISVYICQAHRTVHFKGVLFTGCKSHFRKVDWTTTRESLHTSMGWVWRFRCNEVFPSEKYRSPNSTQVVEFPSSFYKGSITLTAKRDDDTKKEMTAFLWISATILNKTNY